VEVLRKAISDPNYVGEIDWADGTIEAIETAEHAMVKKTARIVEEVSLRQFGSDHVETIRDKLRRHEVAFERIGPDGKVIQQPDGLNGESTLRDSGDQVFSSLPPATAAARGVGNGWPGNSVCGVGDERSSA
jgi:hypothetical protein